MFLLQPISLIALSVSVLFAVIDYRNREVSLRLLAVMAASGVVFCIVTKRNILDVLFAMIPGCMLILLSILSSGEIGLGDGAGFCVLAFLMDWKQVCVILAVSFFLAALMALVIIVISDIKGAQAKGKSLPFLCFMPIGTLLALGFLT